MSIQAKKSLATLKIKTFKMFKAISPKLKKWGLQKDTSQDIVSITISKRALL